MDKEIERAMMIEKLKTAEDWLVMTSNESEGVMISGNGRPNDLIGMIHGLTRFANSNYDNWFHGMKITEESNEGIK